MSNPALCIYQASANDTFFFTHNTVHVPETHRTDSDISPCCGMHGQSSYEFAHLYNNLPFEMPRVTRPEIPSRRVCLTDFGAVGDGVTLNTDAFARAINALSEQGGGHLDVPAGIWLTGPITLKSNIDLHLDRNAVILFSSDKDLYPIIETSFEGLDTRRCTSPINAWKEKNISITGEGVIDGSGDAWRPLKKSKVTSSQWKEKVASGGVLNGKGDVWYPSEDYIRAEQLSEKGLNVPIGEFDDEFWESVRDFLRPVMVSIRECENVLLEGPTFQNSPAWNIHPLMCTNVIVNDIVVRNPAYSQNGDGIDIESCENVILTNSSFDVGDDGICIKSGKDEDGRRRAMPTRNLIIDNCFVYHGHGGFVVGSEMSGGVENIVVSNCRFLGTDVGLRFKSKRGRGGVVRNIYIRDIYMTDIVTEPLLFDLFYGNMSAVDAMKQEGEYKEPEAMPVDETTPEFRDIYIERVVCNGAARAMYFNGLPEMPVSNIHVTDCVITSETGAQICFSKDVTLTDVTIHPEEGEPVTTYKVENYTFRKTKENPEK